MSVLPSKTAIPPLEFVQGVSVVTGWFVEVVVGLQEAAEEMGSKFVFRETLATPTAAVAIAAFLIKFLLFADSIVDSGHVDFLFSDLLLPVSDGMALCIRGV